MKVTSSVDTAAPHEVAVPLVVRYLPELPVCDGSDAGVSHLIPLVAVESTVSTCPLEPTERMPAVPAALAERRAPLAVYCAGCRAVLK